MTTQKALKKIMAVVTINVDKKIKDVNEIVLLDLFAQYMYPKTYKHNKQKAINKTNLDIIVCVNLNYLDIDQKKSQTLDIILLFALFAHLAELSALLFAAVLLSSLSRFSKIRSLLSIRSISPCTLIICPLK